MSRTAANESPAPDNKPVSASGSTVAADAITSALAGDNFPARIAAAVLGNALSSFDVSNPLRAFDTDEPDTAANCSAADRYPSRCHVLASSTRRANSVFADSPNRTNTSNAVHIAGASNTNTASGSNSPTSARIGACNATTSLTCTPTRSSISTIASSHTGETVTSATDCPTDLAGCDP